MRRLSCVGAIFALMVAAAPARAGYAVVNDRASIQEVDRIHWDSYGPDGTATTDPFAISSDGGLVALVGQGSGPFEVRVQGASWPGNFAPGDFVLWNRGTGPSTTIDFGAARLFGGGAQIMADAYGPFVARIEALDGAGNVLSTFTRAGVSSNASEGSAIFLGIVSTEQDIAKLRFSLDSAAAVPRSFAINQFSIAVPEPSAFALLGVGAVGLVAVARRRRARA